MRLADRVAIITGAAQGIGRAYALRFAREGARVVVADIRHEAAEAVAAECRAAGPEAFALRCDVSDEASTRAAAAGYGPVAGCPASGTTRRSRRRWPRRSAGGCRGHLCCGEAGVADILHDVGRRLHRDDLIVAGRARLDALAQGGGSHPDAVLGGDHV